MKDFFYEVNGTEYHDTEAFGKAWKAACAQAKEDHAPIYRTVVNGDDVRYEFFAKGGCFLNMRFYEDEKVKIF